MFVKCSLIFIETVFRYVDLVKRLNMNGNTIDRMWTVQSMQQEKDSFVMNLGKLKKKTIFHVTYVLFC